jgi:ABC-2 type transport system permease protein
MRRAETGERSSCAASATNACCRATRVVGVVAGDSIAGEAGAGTLRYLLTVPVTRGRVVAATSLAVATFTALAVLVVAVVGLAAGGVFISTVTENAIAAMATTLGLVVLSALLDAVPQLSAIHPNLLTHNWLGFGELLRSNVDYSALLRWSGLHAAYTAIFLSLAYSRMSTKDVTN